VDSAVARQRVTSSVARTVRGRSGLWRHKWADREELAASEVGRQVPLFVAKDGTVLETSRGNVFLVKSDGTLVTPPLRDDVLPGVTRRALLDAACDEGRTTELRCFGVAELSANAAFWTSSVNLAVPLHAVDGVPLPRRDREVASFAAMLLARATNGSGIAATGAPTVR
jgi:para-aminobenzoate synthetase/4-amino-4-deoxychorismate lyase